MLNVRKTSENAPVWVREKRAPTRAELADKHVADGGSIAYGAQGNSMDFGGETETPSAPLREISPGIFIKE